MSTMKKKRAATDPRLFIGVLLVAGSVAGVYAIVASADETVDVYSASSSLAPGDRVYARDLAVTPVRMDDAAGLYLAPGGVPVEGLVVSRSVLTGELVPASAVGSADGLRLASLVLDVEGRLAASVGPGSIVDVWSSRETQDGEFGPPASIVSGAIVVRLLESDSIVAGAQTTAIELLVPRIRVARVLDAIAHDDVLTVIPATLP
jgi:hypothetical protein